MRPILAAKQHNRKLGNFIALYQGIGLEEFIEGQLLILSPGGDFAKAAEVLGRLVALAPGRVWLAAGVAFERVHLVAADPRQALWATEQCLRAGCLSAVLCWPQKVDDRALRRLQVAAESGQALVFAFRDARAAAQPSPAALRLQLAPGQLQVLKCRGGLAPVHPVPFPLH